MPLIRKQKFQNNDIIVGWKKYEHAYKINLCRSNRVIFTNENLSFWSFREKCRCLYQKDTYLLKKNKFKVHEKNHHGPSHITKSLHYFGHVNGKLDLEDPYACLKYLKKVFRKYRNKFF